jgi:hypothetical protein
MSTWLPRGQNALGIGVLTLGASVSTLFFYSPKPVSVESPINLPTDTAPSANTLPDWEGIPSSDMSDYQVVDVPHTNYRWTSNNPNSTAFENNARYQTLAEPLDPLPKVYPGSVHRLGSYQNTNLQVETADPMEASTNRAANDQMVPLERPMGNSPNPATAYGDDPRRGISDGNRFGAGKHRPQVAPSYSRDVFPETPKADLRNSQEVTQLPNLLTPAPSSTEGNRTGTRHPSMAPPLPMNNLQGDANSQRISPPDLLRSGPYAPMRTNVDAHSPNPANHAPAPFLSASQRLEKAPSNASSQANSIVDPSQASTTPQFVRQPKK